jgi:hypothetical protein
LSLVKRTTTLLVSPAAPPVRRAVARCHMLKLRRNLPAVGRRPCRPAMGQYRHMIHTPRIPLSPLPLFTASTASGCPPWRTRGRMPGTCAGATRYASRGTWTSQQ